MNKSRKVCPKCRSYNVGSDPFIDGMGAGIISYKCNKCGYSGLLFPEIEEDKNSKKNQPKARR